MTKMYKRTKNFLLYSVVFGAALSTASFLANMFATRSLTQGRTTTSPIPFTPIASADIPHVCTTGDCYDGGSADSAASADSASCDAAADAAAAGGSCL